MTTKLPVSQPPSIRVVETQGRFWRVILHGPDNLQEQDDRPRFCEMDVAVAWTKDEALALAAKWFAQLEASAPLSPAAPAHTDEWYARQAAAEEGHCVEAGGSLSPAPAPLKELIQRWRAEAAQDAHYPHVREVIRHMADELQAAASALSPQPPTLAEREILYCLTCNIRIPDMQAFGKHQQRGHEIYILAPTSSPESQEHT